jgi:hypothetical protein
MQIMRKMRTHGEGLTIDELVQLNLAAQDLKIEDYHKLGKRPEMESTETFLDSRVIMHREPH